jgi:CHAT domain-containing protein/tetratricopeptide (TPR) repeat protein
MRNSTPFGISATIALISVLCVAGFGTIAGQSAQGSAGTAGPDAGTESLKKMVVDGHYAEAAAAARTFVESETAAGRFETAAVSDALAVWVEALYRGNKARDPETETLARQAIDLARRLFGESDPKYAASLSSLANIFFRSDRYDGAKLYWRQALELREKAFGPESKEVALNLNNLAAVEGSTGHFAEARPLMDRAVSIQKKLLGSESLEFASVRHNMAVFLGKTGDLLGAEAEAEQAVRIREKGLPPDHPLIAETLNMLAITKAEMGDYVAARALYERVIARREKSPEADDIESARACSNLAVILASTGRFDDARELYERGLSAFERILGEEHSTVAEARSEMGVLLARMGRFDEAKQLFLRALASQEATFGPFQQDVAATDDRLADAEAQLGDDQAAQRHYQRALEIIEKVYGPAHPLIAQSLNGLGSLQVDAGDLEGAEASFRRALSIREESLGMDHPQVAETLVGLARVSWARNDAPGTLRATLRAEDILRKQFNQVMRGLSESEALGYERIRASGLDVALSVLASTPAVNRGPDTVRDVWSALARSRALVLDRIAARHQTVASGCAPELRPLAREAAAATQRLATLVVRGPDPDRPQDYRKSLAQAAAEKEKLERDLARKSGESQAVRPEQPLSLAGLRSALPDGTVLLAFVEYVRTPAGPAVGVPSSSSRAVSGPAFAAFVLTKDRQEPRVFDLGSAGTIDSLIARFTEQVSPRRPAVPLEGSSAEMDFRQTGAKIREATWDPLLKSLRGARQVFIVPDGSLNLLNFSVLPVGEKDYLIEHGPLLHYLSAERDLLRPSRPARSQGVLLMGGPAFDAPPAAVARAVEDHTAGPETAVASMAEVPPVFRGVTAGCPDFQSLRFEPLPGSLMEVSEIDALPSGRRPAAGAPDASTLRLTGLQASEAAFKRLAPKRRLLHLATHGFFLDPACGAAPRTLGDNPLLLSGIALAGANLRAQAGAEDEDGILTAEEIASLDLSGVEWAVLSACETALGTIQAGEGILGLRRAFEVAGARTLITSLWNVDDRTTLEWMRDLYRRRAQGLSTAEAVRQASLDILKARRAKGTSTHPLYWGGFVAAGDWR